MNHTVHALKASVVITTAGLAQRFEGLGEIILIATNIEYLIVNK